MLDLDLYMFSRYALLLGLLVALLTFWGYQPAYFGDELFPFYVAKTSSSIGEVFLRINDYKPRLVFNGVWTVLAWEKAPRSIAAVINGLAMWWAATAAFIVCRKALRTSGPVALMVGLCVAISRFGVVFYFDYLSGMIGTLGLALFLSNLIMVFSVVDAARLSARRAVAVVLLSVVNIFVYETYIAPLFVLGSAMIWFAIGSQRLATVDRRRVIAAGLAMWALPLALFLLATRALSTLSVATGTAGQPVSIGLATIPVVLHFASNSFLGTNFGLDWFTGYFNADTVVGGRLGIAFAIVLVSLWAMSIRGARRRMTRRHVAILVTALLLGMSTIAISSLPGAAKADARWMFPLSAFVAFMIVSLPYTVARNLLLLAMLGISGFHLAAGSVNGIYNAIGSRMSGHIGTALRSVVPVGGHGLVLGLSKADADWVLGGDALQGNDPSSGAVYCWINLGSGPCVDPESALGQVSLNSYDFALMFPSGISATKHPYLVPRHGLPALVAPTADLLSNATLIGGASAGWSNWTWSPKSLDDGLDPSFSSERIATLRLSADELAGRAIAYQAYSDATVRGLIMRLQVNWLDDRSRLVFAQIKLVALTSTPDVYTMLLDRPPGAVTGEIYVSLHAPGPGTAYIKSVAVMQL